MSFSIDTEPRAPTAFVTITAAYIALIGILYLWFPILPYHEEILSMTAAELADVNIDLYQLMTVLVNSVGVSLLTIAVFFFVLGRLAVQHRSSFLAVSLMLFLFTIPLNYLVHSAGGPIELTGVGAILHLGTIAAIYRDRAW